MTHFTALGENQKLIEMAVTVHCLLEEASLEKTLALNEHLMHQRHFLQTNSDFVDG